ncbi:DUF6069 family protein [Nonomuraea sp. NPDC051941]|uniref:DUF6069 family protein n=1 Tax=Nonomuraea sp. NPDC051941 TaxID=3364373 RepID=UPI0037CB7D9D
MNDTGDVAGPASGQTSHTHRLRGLAGTGFFSVVGVVIAVALFRWSARPAERFVWTAVSLTAISLIPQRDNARRERLGGRGTTRRGGIASGGCSRGRAPRRTSRTLTRS